MKLSIASLGSEPGSRYLEIAQQVEKLGFHGYFHNDKKWARDGLVRLGAATQVTKSITLGNSVIDPYTRHPALAAQAVATLAELAPNRFRVMMGSGSHFETLPGYGNPKPVSGIREAVTLMRGLWRGEKVTLDGEIVKFKDGALDWKPDEVPPIYIATRGPAILKLAGTIADGILVGSFATPPGIEYAKKYAEEGLDASGRTWADVPLCAWIYVSVLDSEDDPVPEAVKRGVSFAFWSSRPVLTEMLDELAGGDVPDEFRNFLRDTPTDWSPAVMAELRRVIPRSLLNSLAMVGTAPQIVERLKALRAVGVSEAVIWPFPKDGTTTEDFVSRLARDVMPHL
ncbi:MAG: LLM class flavin-dependent oxidoreductase [Hyphomicrobiales bacterium]|nr:MAG: LLM class flavin-dependent oxidoreductase [Hyphomicrobiales bacterium]